MIRCGAGCREGLQGREWLALPLIRVGEFNQQWGGLQGGVTEIGWLALPPDRAGSLATVGITVTGHSGHWLDR